MQASTRKGVMGLKSKTIEFAGEVIWGLCTDSAKNEVRKLGDNLKARLTAGALPEDPFIEKNIRFAYLQAARGVLKRIRDEKSPQTLPTMQRADVDEFYAEADAYLEGQQKSITQDKTWLESFTSEDEGVDLQVVVNDLLPTKELGAVGYTKAENLTALCLVEIVKGVNEGRNVGSRIECPAEVKAAFLDNENGWFPAFRFCVAKELTSDDHFQRIITAYQLAKISNDLEALKSELHSILCEGVREEFLKSFERIFDDLEVLKGGQQKVNDFIDNHADELSYLRDEEKKSNRQIGMLLSEMGIFDEAPEKVSEAIKFASECYRKIKLDIERPRTIVSPHKELLDRAKEAFFQCRLKEAESYIHEYNKKQKLWREEQQDKYEQAANEESEGLALEANLALSRRDVVRAESLIRQAVDVLLEKDSESRQVLIIQFIDPLIGYGLILETPEALYAARSLSEKLLEIIERDKYPGIWASAQWKYAKTLDAIGEMEGADKGIATLRNSIEAYEKSREEYLKIENIEMWGRVCIGLGLAQYKLGVRLSGDEGDSFLEKAIQSYKDSEAVYGKKKKSEEWASIKMNLGLVMCELGKREEGKEREEKFQQSIDEFHKSESVYSKENNPFEWSKLQNNIGLVYCYYSSYLKEKKAKDLIDKSISAYKAALGVRRPENFPQKWAMTIQNLGLAYAAKASRSDGCLKVLNYQRAIKSYNLALTVRTKERFPQYWAMTEFNLGKSFHRLGCSIRSQKKRRCYLLRALKSFKLCMQVRSKEGLPQKWIETQIRYAELLYNLGSELRREFWCVKSREAYEELKSFCDQHRDYGLDPICAKGISACDYAIKGLKNN